MSDNQTMTLFDMVKELRQMGAYEVEIHGLRAKWPEDSSSEQSAADIAQLEAAVEQGRNEVLSMLTEQQREEVRLSEEERLTFGSS